MTAGTHAAIAALLNADLSVAAAERARILAAITERERKPDAGPSLLRPREAARRLGVTPRTVRNLARTGTLPAVRLPGRTRALGYRESDLAALIEAAAVEADHGPRS